MTLFHLLKNKINLFFFLKKFTFLNIFRLVLHAFHLSIFFMHVGPAIATEKKPVANISQELSIIYQLTCTVKSELTVNGIFESHYSPI